MQTTNVAKHLDELDALLAEATKGDLYINDLIGPTHIAVREPFKDVAVAFTDGHSDLAEASATAQLFAALKNDAPALIACARALEPFANITVEGEDHKAFAAKFPEMAAKVARAQAALNLLGAN